MTEMGDGAEVDRIRRIVAALGARAGDVGDDCAEVPPGDGTLVVSTDASVEHVHFQRDWLTAEEIGWRATAAALSDLAAQGAEPVGVLAALALPAGTPEVETTALMRGVGAAAASVGAAVLGGDLSRAQEWMITATVLGRASPPVRRSGAKRGDGLWVTGALGGARAALEAWRSGRMPDPEARAAFAHPEPRIAAGRWLAQHGARAMIDLSDGLAADVRHLAAASGVAAEVQLELLPVNGAAAAQAIAQGKDATIFAAEGGEDYELLAALPPSFGASEVSDFEKATGHALVRVGEIVKGGGVKLTLRGERLLLDGFDHFQ